MKIRTKLLPNGFAVEVNSHWVKNVYPLSVWSAFPKALRQSLADNAAYFFTAHFAFENKSRLDYRFPPPSLLSFFTHGLWYSLPEAVLEIPEAKFTSAGLLRDAYNSGLRTTFHGHPYPTKATQAAKVNQRTFLFPFSFGKDSLLTYAVSREIGLKPNPVFFVEPTSSYENANKEKLRTQFQKEFAQHITPFPMTLGNFRQKGALLWGWDMLLTQYTLLLIPYLHYWKPQYFFWSNEQSTNDVEPDKQGYIINTTYEQGIFWTVHLNNLLRSFSSNAMVGSIIEPLHEMAILYILHHRYKEIGKYQLSCFNDDPKSKTQKWCGRCYECARVYIFLLGVGINPKSVGFVDDMLAMDKKKLYYMFDYKERTRPLNILFQSWGERLIAFYLAWKRGVRGELISLFEQQLLPQVIKEKDHLFNTYLKVHSTETIPAELKPKLLTIYESELLKFRREITQRKLAAIEKF
ncbi:hypothetical protein HY967_02545 [Candidatus Jorgensenbacteria bacterium]|nr:hypothetical protein [Candidatus Jorgensenbacteria bacterium]